MPTTDLDATIVGDDDSGIAVDVTDGGATLHHVGLRPDGDLRFHSCDDYPDADERTPRQRLRIRRARRYARLVAYRELGATTLAGADDGLENPDRLAAAAVVASGLSTATLEEQFGDVVLQAASRGTEHEPVIEWPEAADDADRLLIEQDLSLDLGDADPRSYAGLYEDRTVLSALEEAATDDGDLPDTDDVGPLEWLAAVDGARGGDGLPDLRDELAEPSLEAVSPIRVRWAADGESGVEAAPGDSLEAEQTPDATLQLRPADCEVGSIDEFRGTVLGHLRARIRDCYVAAGVVPPEDVRATGRGIAACTDRYREDDLLQPYHDAEATIDWEHLEAPAQVQ